MYTEDVFIKEYHKLKAKIDMYFNEILRTHLTGHRIYLAVYDSKLIEYASDYDHMPIEIIYPRNKDFHWNRRLIYSQLENLSTEAYAVYNAPYRGDYIILIQLPRSYIDNYPDKTLFDFLIKGLFSWISSTFSSNIMNVITNSCIDYFQFICNEYSDNADSNNVFYNPITYINKLSSTLYEGIYAKGRLLLCDSQKMSDIKFSIKFKEGIPLANRNKARKIFEMAVSDFLAVIDGYKIYGLVNINDITDTCYIINIYGIYKWQLFKYDLPNKANHLIMDVTDDLITLYRKDLDYSHFKTIYSFIFPEIKNLKIQWGIIEAARNQKHGTMLLFLEDIKDEVERLSSSCIQIENTDNISVIEAISAIDGAILTDMHGRIYSIGTILDGIINEENQRDTSRGARYNSAINYTGTHKKRCIAVVISEDGHVDVIANGKNLS